jgi:hypothetical protein
LVNKGEDMAQIDIKAKAKQILKIAEQYGVEKNFLFITTFQRYTVQLNVLQDLEKAIEEHGSTVEKEYVKGRKNLYTNPAIKEYNNAVNSANKTVSTLMSIIKTNSDKYNDDNGDDDDPLLRVLNGDYDEDE